MDNDKPLISIVVPVYRVEKYLHKCVDSILNQTYKNLEIILVDDGSPDSCGEICDEYAKNDSRIVVIHKENGGPASARNIGIAVSNGLYISFVDSDDFVTIDYIEYLFGLIVNSSASVSSGRFHSIVYGKHVSCSQNINIQGNDEAILIHSKEIIFDMFHFYYDCSPFAKLFLRSDIIRYNCTYMEDMFFAEDLLFLFELFKNDIPVVIGGKSIYYYVTNINSIVQSSDKATNNKKYESIKVLEKTILEAKDTEYYTALIARYVSVCFHLLLKVDRRDQDSIHSYLVEAIKKHRKAVVADKSARNKTRCACLFSYFGFGLVKFVFSCLGKYLDS